MAETAELLDQCSPEELAEILRALEGGGLASVPRPAQEPPAQALPAQAPQVQALPAQQAPQVTQPPRVPAAPTGPPPAGGSGRRPGASGFKRAEAEAAVAGGGGSSAAPSHPDGLRAAMGPAPTMAEIERVLEQHRASVVSEVRKLLPAVAPPPGGGAAQVAPMDALDLGALTQALAERDGETKALEAQLSALQAELAEKDKRVAELGGELDRALREVRHKQLDLEFQQLKLEERVRSNAELEQNQRKLAARAEEASLNARHAALDADMCLATPRTLRAQGSLPWTVRKNRLPPIDAMTPR